MECAAVEALLEALVGQKGCYETRTVWGVSQHGFQWIYEPKTKSLRLVLHQQVR